MFKKKPHIKPLAPLRSSDRRKLADQIISDYELESAGASAAASEETQTPEQKAEATAARTSLRAAILPDNVQSARFTTTHGPELRQASGTLYVGSHSSSSSTGAQGPGAGPGAGGGDSEPRILWFQLDGRMFPSVYTLWRNPSLVPLLHTPGVVVAKLQGGADLMTPGLARGPPFPARAVKGAVVAVASLERPSVPVAVGVCEIDVAALGEVVGGKGHAVRTVHWAGDEAWGYGAGGKAGQQAPEEIEGWIQGPETSGLAGRVEGLELDDGDGGDEGGVALGNGESAASTGLEDASVAQSQDANQEAQESSNSKEFTQKEIDDAFRNAFLYGVYSHKESNAGQPNFGLVFPLLPSSVMSTLINPFLPAFTPAEEKQLQIKKTSWKNLKKFIKTLDKEKILKAKDKDGNETVILDIDFDDQAFLNFKPYRLPRKETVAGTSQGRGQRETERLDTGDDSVGQKLQLLTFYRPTAKLSPLFASTDKQFLTPPEVREVVTAYIAGEDLIAETNKRLVKLDPTLANAVFDGSGPLDKEALAKGSVPRDALIDRVLHGMSTSHALVRNGADAAAAKPRSGAPPKIHITLETRSGNKTVTKVSGLEPYFINPRLLADELRKVCAGSTSVEPLAGAAKKNERPVEEVMVQGPQKDAVVKALEKRGVDKRWVEVQDKTKGKKR